MGDWPDPMCPSDWAALATETHAARHINEGASMPEDNPLAVGTRVRLFSGSDTGTITKLTDNRRVIILWDTGRTGSWPCYALQRLADQRRPLKPMTSWPHR